MRPVAWATGAVLAHATSAVAGAQLAATLDAGGGSVQDDGYLRSAVVSFTPALSYRQPFASVGASGTVSRFESGNVSTYGIVAGSLFTPPVYRLRVEVSGAAEAGDHSERPVSAQLVGAVRLHLLDERKGAWIGGGSGRASDSESWEPITRWDAGGWARGRGFELRGSIARTDYRVMESAVLVEIAEQELRPIARRSETMRRAASYTDVEAGMRWVRGMTEIAGFAGVRDIGPSDVVGTWGVSGTLWIMPRLAAVIGGGRYAADPTQQLPGARYFTLGLRVASRPAPSSAARATSSLAVATHFQVEPSSDGSYTIRIRAPKARTVELMGDMTSWQPVPLRRVGGDSWEAALPLEPGAYRVNVRINGGAWVVPPTLTTISDDFNGTVGLLIISR